MSYVVLARKYRPQTFSELTGQEHVSRTLQNAIDTGRVAHAFLFTGARGVGKTSSARILAKALNCEQGMTTEPCNVCPLCREITDGTSTDVFEIDGASNTGVDDVRELRDNIKYLPSHSRYKIFIIDEVHMLSTSAFNALLKTLEEPPAHVKFIFATTEPHKVPVTILSRCQRFDFRRIPLPKLIERLRFIADAEQITISDSALALIARKGDGSMRDSLSVFDQILAFCGSSVADDDVTTMIGAVDRRLLAEMSAALFIGDTQAVLAGVKRVEEVGYNVRQFCQELIEQLRNLLVVRSVKKPEEILDLAEAEMAELKQQAAAVSVLDIQRRLTLLIRADVEMATATFPRLVLEIALLKSATMAPVIPVQELLERISSLEAGAVHTPSLPWDAARPVPAAPPPPSPVRQPAPARAQTSSAVPPPPAPSHHAASPAGSSEWERFVTFCVSKSPSAGAVLEHGSPVTFKDEQLVVGFPAGSYYLTSAQDTDFIQEIAGFAREMYGREYTVRVSSISADAGSAPQSLIEKKKSEHEQLMEELTREVAGHPVISEARRIFGAAVTDIQKI